MKSRIILGLFSILVISTVSMAINGNGSQDDPYLIQSIADFDEFADPNNSEIYWSNDVYTRLECNIDLGGRIYQTAVIAPDIDPALYSHQGVAYTGFFDGNNQSIQNLTIDAGGTENDFLGLFGKISDGADVKDLGIDNISIVGGIQSTFIGGLCGEKFECIVSHCYTEGTITGQDNNQIIGGLCGNNYFGVLFASYSTVNISIVGNDGSEYGSTVIGGLCGSNLDGAIIDCYAGGTIAGKETTLIVGGFIGLNYGTVTNSYSTGSITGGYVIGGLCGEHNTGTIYNCYTTSSIFPAIISDVGGLCGSGDDLSITNSFWDTSSGAPDNGLGTALTTSQMQIQTTFTDAGWDFVGETLNGMNEIWQMSSGYPQLSSFSGYSPVTLPGSGTVDDPYLVSNPSQLGAIYHYQRNAHYQLVGNIDLAGIRWSVSPIPIFGGVFKGDGHTLSSLEIAGSGYTGMFGYISGGTITGIGLEDVEISPADYSCFVGSLCGNNWGGTIQQCYATGSIVCPISGDYFGGLVGGSGNIFHSNTNTIEACYAQVNVHAGSIAGGVCGGNYGTNITNCYSTGSVYGNDGVGGLVGLIDKGPYILNCYVAGQVTGSGFYVGAVCGYNKFGGVVNCFWDSDIGGPDNSCGFAKTTAEMKDVGTYLRTVWKFSNFDTGVPGSWAMQDGQYPQLFWQIPGIEHVPDVAQMSLANAQDALVLAGFTIGDIVEVPSLSVSAGQVTGLSVCMDGLVYCGNEIDIYVSTGNNGDGSETTPYPVACQSDIDYIASHPEIHDLNFGMTADIYMNANASYSKALIAADMDSDSSDYQGTGFSGVFNGNGYKITHLSIDTNGQNNDFLGLFGQVGPGSEVQSLELEDISIVGGTTYSDHLGGICGYNQGSIVDCNVAGGIFCLSESSTLGMMCGDNTGVIDNCHVTGNIYISTDEYIGGICGINTYGTISDCSARISVHGSEYVGGLCGYNSGSISRSYAQGPVSGYFYTGGLCGYNYGSINDCYARGSVTGYENLGGFCGYNSGPIDNCYTAVTIDAAGTDVGAFCGFSLPDTITSSFWDSEVAGRGDLWVPSKTTMQMQTLSTFLSAGWDFDVYDGDPATWILPLDDYPHLAWDHSVIPATTYVPDVTGLTQVQAVSEILSTGLSVGQEVQVFNQYVPAGSIISQSPAENTLVMLGSAVDLEVSLGSAMQGQGTESQPYLITTLEAFQEYIDPNNADKFWASGQYARLETDLDLSGIDVTPIGNESLGAFGGVFDGNDHMITNFTYTTDADYAGIFGLVDDPNAVIKNLTLVDPMLEASSADFAGPLAGHFRRGYMYNCAVLGGSVHGSQQVGGLVGNADEESTIAWCYSTADVQGLSQVGGLIGSNGTPNVSHCYAAGNVQGYWAGGLVGWNWERLYNCYAVGDVTGTGCLGGLAGINLGWIVNCYSQGQVGTSSSSYNIGGLVGQNGFEWSSENVTSGQVIYCYSTGKVLGMSDIGGMIGLNVAGEITSSFWDTAASEIMDSAGGTPAATEQLQDEMTFTDAGWNFTKPVWQINGADYPRLIWNDADINNDLIVNLSDFVEIADRWSTGECGMCGGCDLTGDRIVDMYDLVALAGRWLDNDQVADHILEINLLNSWVYKDPGNSNDTMYSFELTVISDDQISGIECITPTGITFSIPAGNTYVEMSDRVIETDRDLNEQVSLEAGYDIYEWVYEIYFSDLADLSDFTDGLYTITVSYFDGRSQETSAWFGTPGTNDPMPQPTQQPVPLIPIPGTSTTSPVTFSWQECIDPDASWVYIDAENEMTDEEVETDDVLSKDQTSWGPIDMSEGSWETNIIFGHFFPSENDDGIDVMLWKYTVTTFDFTVES